MSQPWVEKYRPENFNNIIMDTVNYKFLDNLITRKTLPNLLFYGPPGTGKTTTILNFIKRYQETINNVRDTSLILHLNASDLIIVFRNIITFSCGSLLKRKCINSDCR